MSPTPVMGPFRVNLIAIASRCMQAAGHSGGQLGRKAAAAIRLPRGVSKPAALTSPEVPTGRGAAQTAGLRSMHASKARFSGAIARQ